MPEISKFHFISKSFHWLMAGMILGLLFVGFYMVGLAFSPFKLQVYGLHKSFGILVLVLGILRLGWRFIASSPKPLVTHKRWEKFLSHIIHVVLYGVIFAMPVSGWLMSSAGDFPVGLFGLFEMPDLIAKDQDVFAVMRRVHTVLAYVIIGAVGVHMAGALKHHFVDGDATLQRMSSERMGMVGGVLTTLFFGGALMLSVGLVVQDYILHDAKPVVDVQSQVKGDLQGDLQDGIGEGEAGVAVIAADDTGGRDYVWEIVGEESSIGFTATQYGQSFEGSFPRFDGEIMFDPEDMSGNVVRIEIDVASIVTGSVDRDAQALEDVWFDTARYARAVFEASEFDVLGDGLYRANGDLTLRGVTRAVGFDFTLAVDGARAELEAAFSLNRLDFGVGQGEWSSGEAIGPRVEMVLKVVAVR